MTTKNTAPTFAVGDGQVRTPSGSTAKDPSIISNSVILQTNGKILLVGTTTDSNTVLARYNVDGHLDDSFGNNGISIQPSPLGKRAVIQTDGKILVIGGDGIVLARYNDDATLDLSFGVNGSTVICQQ